MNTLIVAAMAVCAMAVPNKDFNIGASPTQKVAGVVFDGVPDEQFTDFQYLEKRQFTEFFLYLDPPNASSPQTLVFKSLEYERDPTFEAIYFDGDKEFTNSTKEEDIQVLTSVSTNSILYACEDNTGVEKRHKITLTYGWKANDEGTYDDIVVKWTKYCWPNNQPGGSDGNSGMNGAEVFFLVVFILTLVGCTVGCGFNYIVKSRQGFDVVPFSGYFRLCYAKVAGGNSNAYQGAQSGNAHTEYDGAYQSDL